MKKHKRKRKNSNAASNENSLNSYLLSIVKGTVAGIIIYMVMMIIAAFIITKSDLGDKAVLILSILIGITAAFISSFTSVKSIGRKGIISGLLSVIPITLLIFLTVAIINGKDISYNILFLVLGMLISGIIGGIAAVNVRRH